MDVTEWQMESTRAYKDAVDENGCKCIILDRAGAYWRDPDAGRHAEGLAIEREADVGQVGDLTAVHPPDAYGIIVLQLRYLLQHAKNGEPQYGVLARELSTTSCCCMYEYEQYATPFLNGLRIADRVCHHRQQPLTAWMFSASWVLVIIPVVPESKMAESVPMLTDCPPTAAPVIETRQYLHAHEHCAW